ncbi:MAG: GldM family protein [Bacteroidota bacterium]|nr:GldM family protein [Bacteroidota bacterium]
MKRKILHLLLLLISVVSLQISKAQTKVDTTQNAIIAVDNMKVLYTGMENPISVAIPEVGQEFISLRCSDGGDVRMTSFGHYVVVVYPNAPKEISITTLYQGVQKGITNFRVMPMPKAILKVGIAQSGKISKKTIVSLDSIYYEFPSDFIFNGNGYKVSKFIFMCTTKVKDSTGKDATVIIQSAETGAVLSEQLKEVLSKVKNGDLVVFTSIETINPIRPYIWLKEIALVVTD